MQEFILNEFIDIAAGLTTTPQQSSNNVLIPNWVKIAASLLSGGVFAYFVRQYVERLKLRRAIKSEVKEMEGLDKCAKAMESRDRKPSNEPIAPKEIPPESSIPTNIYESNVGNLGVLNASELEDIVGFYSKVLYYKSLMGRIRSREEVPDPDQNDLHDSISGVENERQGLFGQGWMKE